MQNNNTDADIDKTQIKKLPVMLENMNRHFGKTAFILLGCALILLTRLPQFFSDMFFPDGDECIIGLMAKHILEGKDFPFFIYGQSYALAIFETLPAALFFKLFGFSVVSLKAAALCLWTAGWIFFVLFLWRAGSRRIAMIGGLLLIFTPGWGAMSLKAWGTHVTAFAAMNLSLWILADVYQSTEDCKKTVFLLGCCLAIVVLANPVWFIAVIPFIALLLYERRKVSDMVLMAAGTIGLAAIIFLAQHASAGISTYWTPQLFVNRDFWEAVKLIPGRMWVVMTGSHFLTNSLPAGPAIVAATGLWIFSSLLFLVCMAINLIKKKSPDFITGGFAASILVMTALSLFFNNKLFGYRYFLPLIGAFAAGVAVGIDRLWSRGQPAKVSAQIMMILLVFTGMMSLMEFRNGPFSGMLPESGVGERKAITDLTSRLSSQGIRFVYSVDAMLQWQVMFASQEKIKARWFDPSDRYPEYPRAVDRALEFNQKVAVVGRLYRLSSLAMLLKGQEQAFARVEDIDGRYMVIYDPSRALLRKMGFVLNH